MIGFIRPLRKILETGYFMGAGMGAGATAFAAYMYVQENDKNDMTPFHKIAFIVPASIVGGFMWPLLAIAKVCDTPYVRNLIY